MSAVFHITEFAPTHQRQALPGECLDSIVPAIGHVDMTGPISSHTPGVIELPELMTAGRAPGQQEVTVSDELLEPVVYRVDLEDVTESSDNK